MRRHHGVMDTSRQAPEETARNGPKGTVRRRVASAKQAATRQAPQTRNGVIGPTHRASAEANLMSPYPMPCVPSWKRRHSFSKTAPATSVAIPHAARSPAGESVARTGSPAKSRATACRQAPSAHIATNALGMRLLFISTREASTHDTANQASKRTDRTAEKRSVAGSITHMAQAPQRPRTSCACRAPARSRRARGLRTDEARACAQGPPRPAAGQGPCRCRRACLRAHP